VRWSVEFTDEFEQWWNTLAAVEQDAVAAAVQLLQEDGPALRRPIADHIKTSRHRNMRELRPMEGYLRILFAFDPRRTAILLIGGDKANDWAGWYRTVSSYIEALDGHLKLVAEFPDGPVTIDVRPE
jgi:hypothetical protein